MFQRKDKYHVYITHNTYRGMLLEVGRHPGNESIIQMPGIRIGNDFFFDMVSDSGINATYTPTMCEKDHVYADHLSTRLSEYYDFSNGKLTVSQVHRHPDGYLHFSHGDHPANIKLAQQFGGVVNGLIFIDPEFRIKFWYIDENGDETEVEYEINDKAVRAAMPRIALRRLKETVERNEAARKAAKKQSVERLQQPKIKDQSAQDCPICSGDTRRRKNIWITEQQMHCRRQRYRPKQNRLRQKLQKLLSWTIRQRKEHLRKTSWTLKRFRRRSDHTRF
ncbi:MAG TPA: hypothetical protein IAA26_14345 [Candidatus Blautia faecipullorum]|nr:hypothetical protein [Candidatus Blautia faecipullorum]